MKPDMSSAMNPAQLSALLQAQNRANRENKACAVYVAGPDAKQVLTPTRYNVWYVRLHDEPAPEDAELYKVVLPEQKGGAQ